MTREDREWTRLVQARLAPVWHWVEPRGRRPILWRVQVYCLLMRMHRWLWVRGFEV